MVPLAQLENLNILSEKLSCTCTYIACIRTLCERFTHREYTVYTSSETRLL